MTAFGEELFRRTPFKFWALAPVVLFGMAAVLTPGGPGDLGHVAAVALCELAGFLLLLSLWPYHDVPYVRRALAGLVLAVFVVHALDAVWLRALRREGRSDPVQAVLGLLVIGLPCAVYLFRGRFTWRPEPGVWIDPDDPLIVQACADARASLVRLRELFPTAKTAAVRFAFRVEPERAGEEPAVEHLWGEVLALDARSVRVRVLTPPLAGPPPSETLELPLADVSDWELEHPDGSLEGGFTTRAIAAVARRDRWDVPVEVRRRLTRYQEHGAA